ncbi:uncharacterized protein E6C27_scaffold20G00930 [Cucumis melo var. makuwa]|uniref:Uncharacterized protein n=1 Tax=Cucumis melo var. makuwa TaxID=1194695 RepID=A0A5A7T0B2_CUCMM|nr:uncharacterized protein E6C27_scaffold20G00930 [Cucumis melo var. makuwa]
MITSYEFLYLIQAVQLGSREVLLAFCEAVQRSSPVASFTKPVPGTTPGYASEVIFADGTFIDGSTSELSCDGPLREPFAVFCQVCAIFGVDRIGPSGA